MRTLMKKKAVELLTGESSRTTRESLIKNIVTTPVCDELINNVEKINKFKPIEFGNEKWLEQQEIIYQLNIQAHNEAGLGEYESVKNAFVNCKKVDVIIHELICSEIWAEKIYPIINNKLLDMPSLSSYILISHEAMLSNLLEVIMFHEDAAKTAEDMIIELTFYCCRKANKLLALNEINKNKVDKKDSKNQSILEEMKMKCEFDSCISALSILRFIIQHRKTLPLNIITVLLDEQDIVLDLVGLINEEPWIRCQDGKCEIFEDKQWKKHNKSDIRMSKVAAQIWLSILEIVMSNDCRNRYQLSSYRLQTILTLRRHMHEYIYDQLPPLRDLHKLLEQLAISSNPTPTTTPPTLYIHNIPQVRETLLETIQDDNDYVCKTQLENFKCLQDNFSSRMSAIMEQLQKMDVNAHKCCRCQKPADKQCSRCHSEYYCSRECQCDDWNIHKHNCK